MLCSIVIPVAPSHMDIAQEAVRSAENQTVRCEVILEPDPQRTGAAATRNRAIRRASGLFITCLDADDLLEPSFVERCAAVYERGKFVYTDWYQDNEPRTVEPQERWNPLRVYTLITAFWPREMALHGFDETLPSMEDVDFYLWARFNGWHGIHLQEPLWHYRRSKGQSNTNPFHTDDKERARVIKLTDEITKQRYGGLTKMCVTCTTPTQSASKAVRHMNDVQVFAKYSPRKIRGAVTDRMYDKPDAQGYLWVDPRDAEKRPDLFHVVVNAAQASPDVATVESLVRAALTPPAPKVEPKPEPKPTPKPVQRSTNKRSAQRRGKTA